MNKLLRSFLLLLGFSFFASIHTDAQIGRLSLSPRQTITQTIGITNISIDYSRPSMRGRKVFGDLVPFGNYWRTGANRSTTIEMDQNFYINGRKVEKGKYAIFSIPNENEWEVVLYNDLNNWDVPEIVDTAKIIARIVVPSIQTETTKEVFSINVGDFTNYQFDLIVAWENTQAVIPIHLDTKNLMNEKIKRQLEGPNYSDYYLAAVYEMESGNNHKRGLDWINKAIELNQEEGWWDLRVKCILLMNLDRNTEAHKVAKRGLELGLAEKREYAITEFNRMLDQLGH